MTVRLTDRDEALLKALARFRVARTGDLVAYAFPGVRTDTAAARIRRLFDAGFLEVRCSEISEENFYSLGPNGRSWLADQGLSLGRRPRGSLDHHLVIVRTWIEVVGSLRKSAGLTLLAARPDWELREQAGEGVLVVVPDLLVRLRGQGSREFLLAVEVDLGTEPLGVLRRKFQAYETMRQPDLVVSVVLSGVGRSRVEGTRQILREEWTGPSLSWTDEEGPAGALETLRDFSRHPHTDSPYRKGRLVLASPSPATDVGNEGGGL